MLARDPLDLCLGSLEDRSALRYHGDRSGRLSPLVVINSDIFFVVDGGQDAFDGDKLGIHRHWLS